MVKWICMNEILFAEIYYICIAIMLILGFKTYRSMMKNSQKVSFLAVVFVHILYFQTDLVRICVADQYEDALKLARLAVEYK
jgi:chromate transport protein ChrA